jgi:hypothetical protein
MEQSDTPVHEGPTHHGLAEVWILLYAYPAFDFCSGPWLYEYWLGFLFERDYYQLTSLYGIADHLLERLLLLRLLLDGQLRSLHLRMVRGRA